MSSYMIPTISETLFDVGQCNYSPILIQAPTATLIIQNEKQLKNKNEPEDSEQYNKSKNGSKMFKCPSKDCAYGPHGTKFFRKEIFLKNHMKNIHEEKRFHCSVCDQKFAIDWQLRYHQKYCGQQLECETCHKTYDKPTSLVMHCKRSNHELPLGVDFKKRPNNSLMKKQFQTMLTAAMPTNYAILVPTIIQSSSVQQPTQQHSTIIPVFNSSNLLECDKNSSNDSVTLCSEAATSSNNSFLVNNSIKRILPKSSSNPVAKELCETLESDQTNKPLKKIAKKSPPAKRSTDCQTARPKRMLHRRHSKENTGESISIQTQTLHSSFDLETIEDITFQHNNHQPSSSTSTPMLPPKCSSFTQTFDVDDDDNIFSGKYGDPLLASSSKSDDEDEEESHQTVPNTTGHQQRNMETQTMWDNSQDEQSDQLQFSEFPEFVDIETQTIWNSDRTTQTEDWLW